jgi:hypothetical protein
LTSSPAALFQKSMIALAWGVLSDSPGCRTPSITNSAPEPSPCLALMITRRARFSLALMYTPSASARIWYSGESCAGGWTVPFEPWMPSDTVAACLAAFRLALLSANAEVSSLSLCSSGTRSSLLVIATNTSTSAPRITTAAMNPIRNPHHAGIGIPNATTTAIRPTNRCAAPHFSWPRWKRSACLSKTSLTSLAHTRKGTSRIRTFHHETSTNADCASTSVAPPAGSESPAETGTDWMRSIATVCSSGARAGRSGPVRGTRG